MGVSKYATSGYVTDDPTAQAYHEPPDHRPTPHGEWRMTGVSVCFTPHDNHRFAVVCAWNWVEHPLKTAPH